MYRKFCGDWRKGLGVIHDFSEGSSSGVFLKFLEIINTILNWIIKKILSPDM